MDQAVIVLRSLLQVSKRARLIVAGCGVLALLAVVIVPLVVKAQAISWVASHTRRTLTIDSLRLNPLTLGVTLRGVALSEADDAATPFVAFERLEAALSLRSVWDRAAILRKLRLEGARIRLVRIGDNAYNFADLQSLGEKKPAAEAPPQKEPSRFSLNNISVVDGRIDFIDRVPAQEKHHVIDELNIGIPFVGNVPYLTDLYVTPTFRARVNDAPLAFDGKLKPFKDGAETTLDLTLSNFDLAYYLPYLPATLPLRVKSGLFDSKVEVVYAVAKDRKPEVTLSGRMHLGNFAADGLDGAPLAALRDLGVDLLPSRPLAADLSFREITLAGLHLEVHRDRRGGWNLPGLARRAGEGAPPPAEAKVPKDDSKDVAPRIRIASLRLSESSVAFHDELPAGGFRSELQQVAAELKEFDSTSATAATLSLGFATTHHETFALTGGLALAPLNATFDLQLQRLPLQDYYPYLQSQLTAPVSGLLSLQGTVRFDRESGVRLNDGRVQLENLQVPFRRGEGFSLPRLAASGIEADLNRQSYHLEELILDQGRVRLARLSDGSWSPLELLRPKAPGAPAPVAAAPRREKISPRFTLGHLRLNQWRGELSDEVVDSELNVSNLNLSITRFAYPALTVEQATVATRFDGGQLNLEAGGGLKPLALGGRLRLQHLPLPRLWSYIPPKVRVLLVSGEVDSDLRFRIAQRAEEFSGYARGSFGLGNLYLVNADDAEDLLRWENLHLARIDADLGQRRLAIAEIALSGLVSSLTIAPDGTLNFSKVVEKGGDPGGEVVKTEPPVTAPAAPPRDWSVAIDLVTLQNGLLDFNDRHMSPPFHAAMVNLGGRISGLSSSPEMQAEVDLRGNLENRSPLTISGTMNPLSKVPRADLKVSFNDIELSPASPYSGRYLGYTVDKGKLFLDLKYRVENRELAASNQIFLDQFTFGPSVESDDAVNLPVKLAVALLKDRKGEIHLDVPVSGRTDDPEFSIWRIVWQVLRNLLVKAATSPFALLSSLTGGEDFSAVIFAPGSAELSSADREGLAKLAAALIDRPTLKLQLTGYAEAVVDQEPYRRRLLETRIKRLKFLELARSKALPSGTTAETITVTADERPRYLKELYRKEDFPKPRTALGLLKDLPDAEMEKLILSHTVIGAPQLTELAWARSAAVKAELVDRNGLPPERLFQNNVEIVRPQGKGEDWGGSRVEFGVATD